MACTCICTISLLLGLCITDLRAQTVGLYNIMPESYVCYKSSVALVIDGGLDDADWQKAQWTSPFVDIQGTNKPAPRYLTRMKMLWDDRYFYVGALLEEPDVWATLTQRDAVIFHDNDFEIFIDPDGDTHQYYEIEINALNTVWDLLLIKPYRDGGPAVNAWDIKGLSTAVKCDGTPNQPGDRDRGWTVEMALPWEVLKECAHRDVPPGDGDQWRMNFSRVEWRVEDRDGVYYKVVDSLSGKSLPEDNWVWSPQGLVNMHYPEMWGFVQFSIHPVGTELDYFAASSEEGAKRLLRQVYYAQHEYVVKNNTYAQSVEDLRLDTLRIEGYELVNPIQRTATCFEADAVSADGKQQWHITQDGRIWMDRKSPDE